MNIEQTFQAIEETRLLHKLSLQDYLLFIGEAEELSYIKSFITNRQATGNHNYYYDLTEDSLITLNTFLATNNFYQAIIIVSIEDELTLFNQIQRKLSESNLNIPLVRLFADVFINSMCQRNLFQTTADDFIRPQTSYAIMTTPRSGSTYFCDLLSSTKIAGYPIEHLRLANQELALNCNFDYFRLLYNLMQYRITENGVFGTKLISHFLFELRKAKPNFRKIFKSIDKYILLIRKDKVAQAVSLVLAQKTNVWHIQKNIAKNNPDYQSYQSNLENISINDDLLLEVKQKHKFVRNQENRLRNILKVNQIEPLEIIYEDIVANPASQINQVLNFLKISPSLNQTSIINSQIAKMPSEISQAIIRQYREKNQKNTAS